MKRLMYMHFVYQTCKFIIWSKLLTGNQQIVFILFKIYCGHLKKWWWCQVNELFYVNKIINIVIDCLEQTDAWNVINVECDQ